MNRITSAALLLGLLIIQSAGESAAQIPESIATPESLKSPVGLLKFQDGVPTAETAERTFEMLDLVRGINAYNNSFHGASALAIAKGFEKIAEDNSFVIFSESSPS